MLKLCIEVMLLGISCSMVLAGNVNASPSVPESLRRADRFLVGLFDSYLDLLPEYFGAKVYWLYHDNYLASKLLDKSQPQIAEHIRRSIRSYGITNSGKIELLFGEAATPLSFHQPELVTVKQRDGVLIRTEVLTTN